MPAATAPVILVVDDEESFADALAVGLQREGFRVEVAADGPEALAAFARVRPDAMLLDVMLPGLSGIEVCKRIRAGGDTTPIVMVTARDDELDVVLGLELGADDYVTKPYRMRELVARLRAVMRRRDATGSTALAHSVLRVGEVALDPERHEVRVRDAVVAVPRREFELLELLLARAGRVVPRDTAIAHVWGDDYTGDSKTLDVHINRLRARIEDDPAHPVRIVTVRGVGYRYELPR